MTKIIDATFTIDHTTVDLAKDYLPIGRIDSDVSMNIKIVDLLTLIGDRPYIIDGGSKLQVYPGIEGYLELELNDILRLKITKSNLIPAGDNYFSLGTSTYGIKDIYLKGGLLLGNDAAGDIYYNNGLRLARLPISTNNKVLGIIEGTIGWIDSPYVESDPVFTAHTVYNIVNGTGFLKNDGAGNWFYDSNIYLTEFIEEDPVAIAIIGDRQYSEENHITSGDTITKSVDDLDKAIDEFTGNTEELPTEELPTEELPYPITANNYETLRYDETAGEWIASNVLLIKEDKVGIVTSTDNLATKVVVIDDLGNIAHIDKSTLFIPLKVKDPVVAATTANVALSGEQTIDTVTLVTGDRVLVWKQTDATENGIYSVSTSTWTRVTDTDSWDEFIQAYTLVLGGSENLNIGFFCTAATGGTLEIDDIHWVQFTRPGEFSVSNVGTGVEVYKGNVGNTFQFRKLKSSNALFTITLDGDSVDFDIDLSDYATIEYVENRVKVYTFNATTDWTVMAGGYYIDFIHNLAAEVDSEITIAGQKILCNTYAVNNNTLRITVPADYRFAGQIKINK